MDDQTVNPAHALASIDQWLEVQGIPESSGHAEEKPWGRLQSWRAADGLKLAFYSVRTLGHGLPLKMLGAAGPMRSRDPYVVAAEISAPTELLRLWGLKRVSL